MRLFTMETSLAAPGLYAPQDRDLLHERLRAVGFTYIDTGSPADPWRAGYDHVADFFTLFAEDHCAALALLEDAKLSGAAILSIGGQALPREAAAVCAELRKRFQGILAIRPEGTLALAVALEAIEQGFTLVAGPAPLLADLAAWQDRLNHVLFDVEQLPELRRVARLSAELARPQPVPFDLPEDRELRNRLWQLESEGYELETANGTYELAMLEALRPSLRPFEVLGYEVTTRNRGAGGNQDAATVTLTHRDNVLSFTADGVGPIHALDSALRGCLARLYPSLAAVRLTDYRVKVLDRRLGTAARVRVAIDWTDGARTWTTAGVSRDVIQASWTALVDSVRLELLWLAEHDPAIAGLVTDESWAV